jgi:hypothetical protein
MESKGAVGAVAAAVLPARGVLGWPSGDSHAAVKAANPALAAMKALRSTPLTDLVCLFFPITSAMHFLRYLFTAQDFITGGGRIKYC